MKCLKCPAEWIAVGLSSGWGSHTIRSPILTCLSTDAQKITVLQVIWAAGHERQS